MLVTLEERDSIAARCGRSSLARLALERIGNVAEDRATCGGSAAGLLDNVNELVPTDANCFRSATLALRTEDNPATNRERPGTERCRGRAG
jgi:hypothetical protein